MSDDTAPANDETAPVTRVFLLDDHEIVRRGVADLLDQEQDMTVVGQADSAASALAAVEACNPDVAVLDVRLGDGNGIEVCRDIRSNFPETACLMLTSFSDDEAFIDAAAAGAAGYVLKQIDSADLMRSIRTVASGGQLMDRAEVRLRMQRLRKSEDGVMLSLTNQEQRIFELIGEGYSNRQIAEEMFLAEKTVKNYISNLFAKLGITRRTQAAAMAARLDERRKNRFS
jgi:DNA-binding NarL/FixJ family response regulator